LSGIVDVLSVQANTDIVDCRGGNIDQDTGACDIIGAPVLSGQQHTVNFIAASTWFNGSGLLPTSLLALPDFIGIFGNAEVFTNGPESTFEATIDYSVTAVATPEPTAALLLLTGLFATTVQRRRRAQIKRRT
jgi:hypothetical protein